MNLETLVKDLEGKSEAHLRNLLANAHQVESDAKKELYVLRQRMTVLSTESMEKEEEMLTAAKQKVVDSIAYVKAILAKLHGTTTPAPDSIASDAKKAPKAK